MAFKSQIAPKGLQFNPSNIRIGDKYATILTVISYPRYIGPGYLSNVTNLSGVKLVIKHIPVPFSILSKMLNKDFLYPEVNAIVNFLPFANSSLITLR